MRPGPGRLAAYVVGAAAVLAYAWWATGLRPFSGPLTAAIVGAGIVAMAIGHAAVLPRVTGSVPGSAARWLALIAALAAWQLVAFVQHPRSDHPTLSSLTNLVLDSHPVRALAFGAWLVAGALLARR